MITLIIIALLFAGELFFLLWNLREKTRHDKEKMLLRILWTGLLALFLMVGLLDGLNRYGILIAVLLVQSLISLPRIRRKNSLETKGTACRIPGQLGRFFGNLLLYLIVLLPAILFPQYKEPKVTGNHAVSISEYTWVDENRIETYSDTGENRALTVKFWYPEETGTYPLVIFSHGAFGIIDSNYSTCMELASNGYVVASIGHPYYAMFVTDVNGKTTTVDMDFLEDAMAANGSDDPEHEKAAYEMSREWMEIRTRDVNFVLDTILEKADSGEAGPFCKADSEHIGLFGHSLGGAASVAIGRERTDIDAVIDLEGTMLGEYIGYENGEYIFLTEPYPVPLLDVNSSAVYTEANSYENRTYVNFYVGEHAEDFREVIFHDAGHLNFTDLPLVSPVLARLLGTGDIDAGTCIEHVNEMVLNYFNYYLKDAPGLNIPDEY